MNEQYLAQLTNDVRTARRAAADAEFLARRSPDKAKEMDEWVKLYHELRAEHIRILGDHSVFS